MRTRLAWLACCALLTTGCVTTGCAAQVSGQPVADPSLTAAEQLHVRVEGALREADPCGLLDEEPSAEVGEVQQYGSAVRLATCSVLMLRPDGKTAYTELSVLPSMLTDTSFADPTSVGGVEVFLGPGPDLARGTCERVFRLDLGPLQELAAPHYGTVRVGTVAGEDACPVADATLESALARMSAGLPTRPIHDPCEVLPALGGAVGGQVVDHTGPPTPFECVFFPAGDEGNGREITVSLGIKAVGNSEPAREPQRVGDQCRWSSPVGAAINITRDGATVDEFTRKLGHASGVVTVHGHDCEFVSKVAAAAEKTFG